MIPCEESSARKQRLGHISKQGSSLLRFLLVEAAQAAARIHPGLATSVRSPSDASAQKHCQVQQWDASWRFGLYWMWRNGCGVFTVVGVWFVRGTDRNQKWREVERRGFDWASRSPRSGVEATNHGRSFDRRDVWVGLKPTEGLQTEPWSLDAKRSKEQRRPLFGVDGEGLFKNDLTGPTLLEISCHLGEGLGSGVRLGARSTQRLTNRLRLALEPECLENPRPPPERIPGMERIRSRHSSCLWFQILGVEAYSSLPYDPYDGGHLSCQGQPCHLRSHAFGN